MRAAAPYKIMCLEYLGQIWRTMRTDSWDAENKDFKGTQILAGVIIATSVLAVATLYSHTSVKLGVHQMC
jgi:hypothetical protein